MSALRSLFLGCLLAALVLGLAPNAGAQQSGDVFSSGSEPAPSQPLQGGVSADADPVRCFDHALRGAKNALQAFQIVFSEGWRRQEQCGSQLSGGAEASGLGGCWGELEPARALIEQAAELFKQARQANGDRSRQLVEQGNALIREAAGKVQGAQACFKPIFAQWQGNGGKLPPQQSPPQQNPPQQNPPQSGEVADAGQPPLDDAGQPEASPPLLKGYVEKHEGEPPAVQDEPPGECVAPPEPDVQQRLMNLAGDLDRMVDNSTAYSLAASDRFFDVMAETVSARMKALAAAAADPPKAAQQTADAIVGYLTSDYNENNAKLYDGAVAAVDEIQRDPAAYFAVFAVDQATNLATGAVGGGAMVCANKVGAAAKAAQRARQIARAEKAAERLKAMDKRAGKFAKLAEDSAPDAGTAPRDKPGFGSSSGGNAPASNGTPAFQTPSAEMVFCEGLPDQCFPVALAQADTWETGMPHVAMPTGPSSGPFPLTPWAKITERLKNKYGRRQIAGLPPERQALQELGCPQQMPDKQAILDEFWNAPDNSQGLVFVRQFADSDGHVINVGKFQNQVVWKDMTGKMEALHGPPGSGGGVGAVTGMDPAFLLEGNPAEIYLYRVW